MIMYAVVWSQIVEVCEFWAGGFVFVRVLCPTLCDPLDCCPPDSSVHGIFRARIPEEVASPYKQREANTF